MAVDIYTKAVSNGEKWRQACELVNILDPKDLKQVIERRAGIFAEMQSDQQWHPINRKPQCGTSATHGKWMETHHKWLASDKTK